jgi:hypothetical protein
MDFLNRNANNQPQAARTSQSSPGAEPPKKAVAAKREPRWLRIIFVVLLFSVAILAVSITLLLYFGKDRENQYVDTSKQQAVFLTNGQVYFGKIARINRDFVDLQSIYYLNSQQAASGQQQATQQNFSLVKLGCELHGPVDQMVINRDQISFWENLKGDGKVSKAIDQWVAQNPNGQNCDTASTNSTQQSTGTTQNKQP